MTKADDRETISEEKILVTSRRFNASITDEPVNSALVKPMPIIAPIKVCELEAGKPKNHVPGFQIIAASSMEKTIARPWVDPIFSNKSVGNIWTMA